MHLDKTEIVVRWPQKKVTGETNIRRLPFCISSLEYCMRFRPNIGHPQQKPDFGEYLDGLFGYAMVLSHNHADAEDLVQETCLRALRAVDRLREQSNVKGWLFTILRNIWLNQVRRTPHAPMDSGADNNDAIDPADPAPDPHAVYISRIEREQVRAAIQQLPAEYSEIIVLREYEELSYQEISAVLNCPPGTVMSRLARARARLRDLLLAERVAPPAEPDEVGGTDRTAA
jgi:RNA polymerase sigma-70 factor, ECF subfamily